MRAKKTVSLILLAAFAAPEWSCVSIGRSGAGRPSTIQKNIAPSSLTNVKTKIAGVITKEGKKISFPEKSPANLDPNGGAVVGVALQQFVFTKNEVEIVRDKKKDIVRSVTTRDGRFYEVLSSLDEGDHIRVNAYAPISIPLSDIQQISILKPDRGGGAFVAIVLIAGAGVIGYLIGYFLYNPFIR